MELGSKPDVRAEDKAKVRANQQSKEPTGMHLSQEDMVVQARPNLSRTSFHSTSCTGGSNGQLGWATPGKLSRKMLQLQRCACFPV